MGQNTSDYRPLQKMFMDVPSSYDLLNRLLTFRFDELWREQAANECMRNNPEQVLDLCCGTGDLALRLRKIAPCTTEIHALDYSEPMLAIARKKALNRNLMTIRFRFGDAAAMPFMDGHFDTIGIAFAFRNLTYHNKDRDKFLAEILRVLRPGGRFVIIETSQPGNPILRKLFHAYLKYITGPVGGWLSGYRGAYTYLAHSALNYYNETELKDILLKAGFQNAESKALLGGVAALMVALK
jgi:demethylmenaquinone methyltransferase/2-methoxy-6-polyprenyl-1,4-benzoquinol methylase